MWLRFIFLKPQDFGIKIISIGNLNVGGSGKTPLTVALANRYDDVAIVLRGYGRKSRGLVVVKDKEKILCDVEISGDEAMIYAQSLSNACVIVSEDRSLAIEKAKAMGVNIVFLDDGYSKHHIKKLDILIDVDSQNKNCLPAGPMRERLWHSKDAIVLRENYDFFRNVSLKDKCDKMSLVTAIARPQRLDVFLPELVDKHYFEDHHSFTKEELFEILQNDNADSLLVTQKDYVKIESFGLPLSLLDLELKVNENVFNTLDEYLGKTECKRK